jgi:Protein of unknown function (DUF4240)
VTGVPPPEEPAADPRDALIREQAQVIAAQAERIAALEALVGDLRERLAAAERAGSRNSGNSSMPPGWDDLPRRKPPRWPPFTVTGMDIDGFWLLLERSAGETAGPRQRIRWLEHRLSRVSRTDIVDFQVHLDTARRPIDTYAMWGAASLITDGLLCSDDGFWYFQPWLIGQGQRWYQFAARNPDNLAGVPAVRTLAGRRPSQWADAEWPQWEELDYVASSVHDQVTGQEDSINDALAARGHLSRSSPAPADPVWDFGNLTEIQRRLPRLASLFPRQRYLKT